MPARAAAAAVASRRSNCTSASSDSDVGKRISITSPLPRSSIGKPLLRKTSIMRWLWGSTSAMKTVMPSRWAAAASCPSMTVAMPCPCQASATTKATSARPPPART